MIESQRWFPILTFAVSVGIFLVCWLTVRPELAHLSMKAGIAAGVLFSASMGGLYQLVRLFLPLALAKAFPRLDRRE